MAGKKEHLLGNRGSALQAKAAGFTIMELMIAIAIIAILSAIAVPNMISYRMNSQFRAATQDVFAKLQKAKMNAVKTNVRCAVAFNQVVNGVTNNYLMFNDGPDAMNVYDGIYTAGEDIVASGRFSQYGSVQFDTAQGGGSGTTFGGGPGVGFYFGSDGMPRRLDGAPESGSIFLMDAGGRRAEIQVSTTGFIRIN